MAWFFRSILQIFQILKNKENGIIIFPRKLITWVKIKLTRENTNFVFFTSQYRCTNQLINFFIDIRVPSHFWIKLAYLEIDNYYFCDRKGVKDGESCGVRDVHPRSTWHRLLFMSEARRLLMFLVLFCALVFFVIIVLFFVLSFICRITPVIYQGFREYEESGCQYRKKEVDPMKIGRHPVVANTLEQHTHPLKHGFEGLKLSWCSLKWYRRSGVLVKTTIAYECTRPHLQQFIVDPFVDNTKK